MKKSLIATSIASVLASGSFPLLADDNVLVVTANRVEQNINEVLGDVEVLERADIERIQPQSLVDLLVNIAGVDFTQTGGHAQDTSIFVRGSNSNHVLVLIDGIRVGSATLGNKAVASIPMAQIERVEIVKGPRAAIWGSDAIGGVIQIFTRNLDNGEYRVAATIGSNSAQEIDAAIGFGGEKISNTLSVSSRKSDGFDVRIDDEDDKDGFENQSVAIRGDYQVSGNGVIDWIAQIDDGEYDYDNSFGASVSHYKNSHYSLRYSHQAKNWNHQVAVKGSKDRSFSYESYGLSEFETRRQMLNYLVRNQVSDTLSVGGGLELAKDKVADFTPSSRDTESAFVNVNYVGETYLMDFALRSDDVEAVANETTFNLGAGMRINADHIVSINFGQGFKAPTFNDLYYPGSGNPDLQFETSDNVELIYKGNFGASALTVSIFDSEIENLIQWAPNAQGFWFPGNVGTAEISGMDFSYAVTQGDYTHKVSGDIIDAVDTSSPFGDADLIRRAKNHFGYELSFTGENFDWFAQVQYVGKRPDTDFQTFASIESDSYTRINLGASYMASRQWKLQLKVNDALNEAPTIVSGYNPLEREVYFTVSYQSAK